MLAEQNNEEDVEKTIQNMTIEDLWGPADKPKDEDNVAGLLKFMMTNTMAKETVTVAPKEALQPVEVVPVNERDELRKAAKFYLDADISVIPVGMDKIPLIPWKVYQERRATIEEVDAWLRAYPQMQIGLVTGAISKLIVVDVENGGDPSWLPETATVKTGGGGWHFYYSYVPGVNNKARIKPLVDIRGDGGYVVAPPSKTTKGAYSWLKQINPIQFPKDLFEIKKTTDIPQISTNNQTSPVLDDEYLGYPEGQRNDEMARYIGKVLKWVHPSDWDTVAWLSIIMANDKNRPPLTEAELRKTFESIKAAEKRSQTVDRSQRTVASPISELWKDEDDEVLPFDDSAKRQTINLTEKIPTKMMIFDDATMGGMDNGDLIIVSGQTAHGKTSFCQHMTMNLVDEGFPCLWFSYEVLTYFLWEKFKSMGAKAEDFLGYVPLKHVTGQVEWIENKIIEAKKKFLVKVVFIDHLGFLLPRVTSDKWSQVERNFSAYLGNICRELKKLAIKEEIVIVLPVHMRKTDNPTINDIRDSSGIAQEADLVFTLNREKNSDEEGEQEYTDYTRVVLAKNRKTGKSVRGWFTMNNGRFIHDPLYIGTKVNKKRYQKKYGEFSRANDD